MTQLEQWDDFKYQEGDRQAKADRAVLEQSKDQITLSGSARIWDPTGSTAAKTIVMAQTTRRCAGRRRCHVDAYAG